MTQNTDSEAAVTLTEAARVCAHDKGWRYAVTVRRTKETIAAGTVGKVVMICKQCPKTKLV